MFRKIYEWLWPIWHPSFWNSHYIIDAGYDKWLRHHLNIGTEVKEVSYYRCSINDVEIWIQNYPYSFGQPYDKDRITNMQILPKRYTRMLLHKKVCPSKRWEIK